MRRPILLTLLALGAISLAVGSTGLFAALSDTAKTATNSVESDALGSSADLQLGVLSWAEDPQFGPYPTCSAFEDNLTTPLFTVTGATPSGLSSEAMFCVRNAGAASVTVSAAVDELVDTDVLCTGDEADAGDTSCGDNQAGELSAALAVQWMEIPPMYGESGQLGDCREPAQVGDILSMGDHGVLPMGTLAPGATMCLDAFLSYHWAATAAQKQQAQSDRLTWRFAFTGQA